MNKMEDSLPGQTNAPSAIQSVRTVVYDYRLFLLGFLTGASVIATGTFLRNRK